MDRAALEERIAALEAQIEAVRQDMEPLAGRFLAATARFAAGWFQQHVEAVVLGKPDVTKTLSRDALRGLKAELRQLVDRAPALVQAHLGRDPHWAHRRTVLDDSALLLNLAANPYEARPGHPPAGLHAGVHDVLMLAEQLLDRYGFGPPRRTDTLGPPPRRRLAFEWTEEMSRAAEEYASRYDELRRLNAEVLPLRRRRGETDARRLWEQA